MPGENQPRITWKILPHSNDRIIQMQEGSRGTQIRFKQRRFRVREHSANKRQQIPATEVQRLVEIRIIEEIQVAADPPWIDIVMGVSKRLKALPGFQWVPKKPVDKHDSRFRHRIRLDQSISPAKTADPDTVAATLHSKASGPFYDFARECVCAAASPATRSPAPAFVQLFP